MTIMVIVFAAIVPQFRAILNSWDSKAGAAETIQNGRVLIEHLNRNLSKAVQITAVSGSAETDGYIEFEDNDGNNLRYDINSTSNYVEFGVVGELSDLAGPASQLQLTCYDANDLDTAITDVNSIRFVKVETTLTNPAELGQDKTFTAWAYLRANSSTGSSQAAITKGTPFEYDISDGLTPALAQIDSTHYLCAYIGPDIDGWAVVLTVDTGTWTITAGTPFKYETTKATTPALAQIDSTHYLCVYSDKFDDGFAVVLTVDTGTWNITKETPFEYETSQATTPALAKIDSTHYLCVYTDKFIDGQAVVLTVDTGTWTITKETPFEYETAHQRTPALAKIDDSHYLCAYGDWLFGGRAVVLTVDTGTWAITAGTPFQYDTSNGETPALAQIDSTHYLCAYDGDGDDGWAVVLTVNTGTWAITKETPFEYDTLQGKTPALAQMDSSNYLCAYTGVTGAVIDTGWSVVLTVDTGTWAITKGTPFEYDSVLGNTPALAQIDPNDYLCAYDGPGNDGWSVVLNYTSGGSAQVLP